MCHRRRTAYARGRPGLRSPRRLGGVLLLLGLTVAAAPANLRAAQGGAGERAAPPPRPALVEPAVSAAYRDAIEAAREAVRRTMDEAGIPGVSVAVGVNGEIVWSEGFGWADLEQRVPVTPLTRFRVGSVSKPMTAAALGLLVDEGALDLDAPVQRYVPGFPEKRWPITTRQVAGHIAGIRHYRGTEMLSSRHYGSVEAGLEIFAADTLLFEPGTRYSYSSYGWNLISAVVEGASGRPFLEFMDERVFAPLGLRHTTADQVWLIVPHRTRFYARGPTGRIVNAPFVDNSYKWAGGGFLSTPEDLVRFGTAHLRPGFLRQETLDEWFTSQRLNDGTETGYGIGWRTTIDERGERVVSHSGGSVGGTTMLIVNRDRGLVVAAVGNLSSGPIPALGRRIHEIFRDHLDGR
ncbi:MAG: class A beta-lactamase-related serine hydrolase [Gemmatimonadetes bacterium]|nr:MAG: class A beta-lactamase-related serine hydrolase [Gemmatimonadota bacterium]